MSDAEIRTLERRFRETRAVDDEVAWLTARLRAGHIKGNRVHAAALLGDQAAAVVANTAAADPRLGQRLSRWDPRRVLAFAKTPDIARWIAAVREHEGFTGFEELYLHAARGVADHRGEIASKDYLCAILSDLPYDVFQPHPPLPGAAPSVSQGVREIASTFQECSRLIQTIKLDLQAGNRNAAVEHATSLEVARRSMARGFEEYLGPPDAIGWVALQRTIRAAVVPWLLGLDWKTAG